MPRRGQASRVGRDRRREVVVGRGRDGAVDQPGGMLEQDARGLAASVALDRTATGRVRVAGPMPAAASAARLTHRECRS